VATGLRAEEPGDRALAHDGVRPLSCGRMGGRALGACTRAAALALAAGCGDPSASVVVVWVDDAIDENGNRALRIYDGGERRERTFEPTIPGSSAELLQLAVDREGRGFVASGIRSTVYTELGPGGGRVGTIDTSLVDEGDATLAADFTMTRNGDAILREIFVLGEVGQRWAMLPTRASFGLRMRLLETPGAPVAGARWERVTAADAPVIVWMEVRDGPSRPEGALVAVAYPGDEPPGGGLVEPMELARGFIEGRGIEDASGPGRSPSTHCPRRLCVSPSGRVVYTMAAEPCTLWRWSWTEKAAPDAMVAPHRVVLPGVCPSSDGEPPWIVAAVGDDRIVMDDEDRLYLYDLRADVMQSIPKLARGLSRVEVRDEGRALLHISHQGEVVRIDEDGPRLLSTERGACTVADDVMVSPSGNWVIMTCAISGGDVLQADTGGLVMRVSALGLDQLGGIAMRPLGIDDEGNALLYSFDRDEVEATAVPRGMFVLSGDGQLSRVDELEPPPAEIALSIDGAGRTMGRFATAARP
jgi:hypothetical protein